MPESSKGARAAAPISVGQPTEMHFLESLERTIQNCITRKEAGKTGGTGSSAQAYWQQGGQSDVELISDVEKTRDDDTDNENVIPSSGCSCKGPWVINPNTKWKVAWDVYVGVLIVYTIIVVPWRIGFAQDAVGDAFIFDTCVDCCFGIDAVFCFRTGFYNDQQVYVTDSWLIAKGYLSTYFVPDVLSFFPLDLVVNLISGQRPDKPGGMKSLKLMKFVRLVRLMKLVRLRKLQRFMNMIAQYVDEGLLHVLTLMVRIVFLIHILSCCWFFIAVDSCQRGEPFLPDEGEATTWLLYYGVCRFGQVSRYIVAFHFTTATMMAVGYGSDITATNTPERVLAMIMQLIGSTAFGFILSAVTTLAESTNPRDNEYKKRMVEVNDWLEGRNVPSIVRQEVYDHFVYAFSKKSVFNEVDLVGNMPTQMRNQIVIQSYGQYYQAMWHVFEDEDIALISQFILLMKPQLALCNERVLEAGEISLEVHFVISGFIEMVCSKGITTEGKDNWVQECLKVGSLMTNKDPKDLTYCGFLGKGEMFGHIPAAPTTLYGASLKTELMYISKDDVVYLLGLFPGAHDRFDKAKVAQHEQLYRVLTSPELPDTLQRHTKSLVLIGGKATPFPDKAFSGELPPGFPQSPTTVHPDSDNGRNAPIGFRERLRILFGLGVEAEREVSTMRPDPNGKIETVLEKESESLNRWIVPINYGLKQRWDMLIGIFIAYSVLGIPIRICFSMEPSTPEFIVDLIVDVCFFLDMAVVFRTAYVDVDGVVCTVPKYIAFRYLRSWFAVDFFSTMPIDHLVEAVSADGAGDGAGVRAIKMVRIARMVKLLKLVRLLKMGRLMTSLQSHLELPPVMARCFKLGGRLILLAHMIGCFWFFVSMQVDTNAGACESGGIKCIPGEKAERWWYPMEIHEDDKWAQYVASIYWAITTMTTVGYGDIIPNNDIERVYAAAAIMVGATVFGYIIGSIASLASHERGIEALTKKKLKMIRKFCQDQNVSNANEAKVRLHFQFYYNSKSPYPEDHLLSDIGSPLRKRIIAIIHRDVIKNLDFFQCGSIRGGHPHWFVCWIARLLDPQVFSPGDDIVLIEGHFSQDNKVREIYFVSEGECIGYLFLSKETFGGLADTGGSSDHDALSPTPTLCDSSKKQDSVSYEGSIQEGTPDGTGPVEELGRVRKPSVDESTDVRHARQRFGVPKMQRFDKSQREFSFTPGCMFGVEYIVQGRCWYNVRCSNAGPCFLYVLRHAAITDVFKASVPELSVPLRNAISAALLNQMRLFNPVSARGNGPKRSSRLWPRNIYHL